MVGVEGSAARRTGRQSRSSRRPHRSDGAAMMASGELLLGLQPLLRLQPPDANNNDSSAEPQQPQPHGNGAVQAQAAAAEQVPPQDGQRARTQSHARDKLRFRTLRRAVPPLPCGGAAAAAVAAPRGCEKLTKITTLRLAMNYIAALTQILSEAPPPPPPPQISLLEPSVPSTLDLLADADPMFDDIMVADAAFDMLLESDGESLHFHSDLSEQSTP
ncbi:Hypothetical predicted protein [Cloeon dipterum]|uniref:BHLH domain-containing protein n=1 Tax=Cloeon dipterum TaxID=197152 RepID=A0A8S1CQ06_9INSE|nr:Hypothetical predicted protein [Cloeon dipterum]